MNIVIIIRIVVWATFVLLIAGEIAGIIFARHAVRIYFMKHRELEVRVEAIERRLQTTES